MTPETLARAASARGWIAFTRILALAIFAQSVIAGLLLSGEGWGRAAHRLNALGLVAAAGLAGIWAAATLRRTAAGRRLARSLLALALALIGQMTLGLLAAGGARLLWLHVPLGVVLIGFTLDTVGMARRLGESSAPLPDARGQPAQRTIADRART